jgi:hypothetical protein
MSGESNLHFKIEGPAASPEEAAAVVAAIERFVADTTRPAAPKPQINPWQQAALFEGVMAKRRAFPAEPGAGLPFT